MWRALGHDVSVKKTKLDMQIKPRKGGDDSELGVLVIWKFWSWLVKGSGVSVFFFQMQISSILVKFKVF